MFAWSKTDYLCTNPLRLCVLPAGRFPEFQLITCVPATYALVLSQLDCSPDLQLISRVPTYPLIIFFLPLPPFSLILAHFYHADSLAEVWANFLQLVYLLAHFLRRVPVGSVCKGGARVTFPPPKVAMIRTEPYWAILILQYYSVGVLRHLKGCRQVWATNAIHWLVNRIVPSVWQVDNNKQTQYPQGISGQWWKLCLLKKMLHKSFT